MLLAAELPTRRDSRLIQFSNSAHPTLNVRYSRSPLYARLLPWTTAKVLRSLLSLQRLRGTVASGLIKTVKVR